MGRRAIRPVAVTCLLLLLALSTRSPAGDDGAQLRDSVVFPDDEWGRISPEQAGLDVAKFNDLLNRSKAHADGWGGTQPKDNEWGAVLTRGGYLVHTWGDPKYRTQSASLGKCLTRALFGLSVEAGVIKPDEPMCKTWAGQDELSHPHKYLDNEGHRTLTWRHLLEHQGGFVLESGHHWRTKTVFHARIPDGVEWTGDPMFDNFSHITPGTVTRYSSGGYVRLGQALTAAWKRDLKDVLDERLFRHIGIPADRWDWLPCQVVNETKNFYPDIPHYGEYVDPPYKIGGHVVRGGPGWVVMSAEDLARFGLLIATGGVWNGKRLIGEQWLRGHSGVGIHVVAGDPETMVSIAKINTKDFPFGRGVGTQGGFSFPKELIAQKKGTGPICAKHPPGRSGKLDLSPFSAVKTEHARIPMRDGITLGAAIYRPDAPGKFPVLMLLRYFREGADHGDFFARRGYVVALVDSRGRGDSEGQWKSYVNEPCDGYDAQEWLGRQTWSNGKIGTFGISYNAFTQSMAAPLGSPHLRCLFPEEGQQTNFGHLYNDGVMQLNVVFQFGLFTRGKLQTQRIPSITDPHYLQLPLISAIDKFPDVQHVKDWFEHSSYDEYWKSYGIKEKYSKITVPAYFTTGWYDNLCHESWRNFCGFREQGGSETARTGTKILVGPWKHGGSRSYPGLMDLKLRWYDYWLKGIENGIDKEPPIKIFVMGANQWRDEHEWPLERTQFTNFYITSSGKANSVAGDGCLSKTPPSKDSSPDEFVYDPEKPVYTAGGQISTLVPGPRDRQETQRRDDILVYTSEPLDEDREVTGPVKMKLYAASDAVNTDFTATLTDVHPDGKAIHICEGIRGVTFRESLENPTFITPGQVYEYTIDMWETSMVFRKGHRIRLEISSSNFPRYARSQNTDKPLGTSAELNKARQTIFHNATYPSHLVLPLIPIEKPKPIDPAVDGALTLPASKATVSGPSLKLASNKPILGWWSSEEDRAEWTIRVEQAGQYRVELDFACHDNSAGNQFELAVGDARLVGQVPGTGTWYDLRQQEFGKIELAAGVHELAMRAKGELRGALLDLRTVRLIPVTNK